MRQRLTALSLPLMERLNILLVCEHTVPLPAGNLSSNANISQQGHGRADGGEGQPAKLGGLRQCENGMFHP